MPGCPMCEMLAGKLTSAGLSYDKIIDRDTMKDMGITHVPMLQVDENEPMGLADAMKYIKGVTA